MPESTTVETPTAPYLPVRSPAERAARNARLKALLDRWVADDEDGAEQRETLDVIREALGSDRVASSRRLFP